MQKWGKIDEVPYFTEGQIKFCSDSNKEIENISYEKRQKSLQSSSTFTPKFMFYSFLKPNGEKPQMPKPRQQDWFIE